MESPESGCIAVYGRVWIEFINFQIGICHIQQGFVRQRKKFETKISTVMRDDCTTIERRSRNDLATIARRLHDDLATIARRSRDDRTTLSCELSWMMNAKTNQRSRKSRASFTWRFSYKSLRHPRYFANRNRPRGWMQPPWICAFPSECFENISHGYVFWVKESNRDNDKILSSLHDFENKGQTLFCMTFHISGCKHDMKLILVSILKFLRSMI